MKSFVRNLSSPAEFCLIILICFVFAIAGSIEVVVRHFRHITQRQFMFPDRILPLVMGYELLALAAVFWIGRVRGWSFFSFGFRISWATTGVGILLFGGGALFLKFVAPAGMIDAAGRPGPLSGVATLPVVLLFCVINPFFEETMETGYFVHRLQGHGMWSAVLASACFRAVLHAFFGLMGMALVLCVGVVFGLVYWRWRSLWPLLLAHALMDYMLLRPLIGSGAMGV